MLSLSALLTLAVGFAPATWNSSQIAHDERVLGLNSSTAPVLIDRFRKNMLTAAEEDDVRLLVDQLGSDDFRRREKAHQELVFWRAGAEATLRRHEFDANLERRTRVRQILERGLGRWSPVQAESAARLLRRSPSVESVKVLIEYVPYADDAGVRREIAATLRDFAAADAHFAETIRAAESCRAIAGLLNEEKGKELSPTLQSLDQARGFFGMVAQGDTSKLVETTRLPFALGNGVVISTSNQRDDFFKQAIANYRAANQNSSLTFLHVSRAEEYLRFADDQEREFLANVPADEMRAVHVRLRRDWQTEETGAILVRVGASGPVVIGLGQTGIRGVRK